MQNYIDLLEDIIENGEEKKSRSGDTLSVVGRMLRWDMTKEFPLLTVRKISFHNIVHELLWMLGAFDSEWSIFGNTNIRYLVDHNVNIWNDDAYRGYVERNKNFGKEQDYDKKQFIENIKSSNTFASTYGDLGKTYGHQMRRFGGDSIDERNFKIVYDIKLNDGVDQIQKLINSVKTNPFSRRHLVSSWNPSEVDNLTLPPCHWSFLVNVNTKNEMSLMWNQRSVDCFLGLPYNIAYYGLLLKILCFLTDKKPKDLIFSGTDVHLYKNQLDATHEVLKRKEYPDLPQVNLVNTENINRIEDFRKENFSLEQYNPLSIVKAPLSVGL